VILALFSDSRRFLNPQHRTSPLPLQLLFLLSCRLVVPIEQPLNLGMDSELILQEFHDLQRTTILALLILVNSLAEFDERVMRDLQVEFRVLDTHDALLLVYVEHEDLDVRDYGSYQV